MMCNSCRKTLRDSDDVNCERCWMGLIADHIPRTSLPKLPEGWSGPFTSHKTESETWEVWGLIKSVAGVFAEGMTEQEATFIANLFNACYPANQ